MPDFSKGVIYKITTPNGLYIGSSCNFKQRECEHRQRFHNNNCKSYNIKLYQNIRENSGVWEMEKIKDFPCENYSELRKEETKYMIELNSNLNVNRAYRTEEEAKEQQKEYGETNKETIKKQRKEYNQVNKEKISKKKKEHRYANIEQFKEKDKKYYQANKEQISKQKKEYYQGLKEKIKEQRREVVVCECGCKSTKGSITRHRQTKKHLNLLSNK